MLALDVAASAPSPRKRPTQIALTVPFSDWRIDEASVGRANFEQGRADAALGQVAAARCSSVRHANLPLAEPLQRGAEPLGLGGLGVMVGAGLFDRFGLGALGEGRVGEARGEAVAVLLGGRDAPSTGAPSRRRGRSRSPSGKAMVAPSTTICAEPGGDRVGGDRRWPSLRHARQRRRIGRSGGRSSPHRRRSRCGTSVALHGMLSSARMARTSVTIVDQPVDLACGIGSRCASGSGHLATISS